MPPEENTNKNTGFSPLKVGIDPVFKSVPQSQVDKNQGADISAYGVLNNQKYAPNQGPVQTPAKTAENNLSGPKSIVRTYKGDLESAIAADSCNRAALAKDEIAFALEHQPITTVLINAGLPERITHNDTKFNNVMLDDSTGEGLCVIDLDTVMPGLALYDFGDQVRTTTSPAKEDERDLSKVGLQFAMFEALVRGYLSEAREFLTPAERRYLVLAGKLITFEIGIRFLADYLAGDVYFKIHRDGHNLDRCRTQFRLVESIEQQENQMHKLLEKL